MNNSIYDEYMRSVLGYQPVNDNNTYDMNYENWEMSNMSAMSNIQIRELESCYPDIYRIVYPMIQRACNQNTRPITREIIDSMTEEIYYAIEDKEMIENRNKDEKIAKSSESSENRYEFKNTGLKDLIRILLLRELLGRPLRPRPLRPPMRPPVGPPRPQLRRQSFGQYDDLYEY